jgi:3-dehydroquinate synthase
LLSGIWMQAVAVALGPRSYPIQIGAGTREVLRESIISLGASAVAVIADADVARLHVDKLLSSMSLQAAVLTFPGGENSKSLSEIERLAEALADVGLDRGGVIVTFGGGVAGDLGGFLASVWLRGVRFLQIPTSLLAAVDASVGGKTGVNLAAGKNLIGAFHQPAAVIVDTDFLETLPEREFIAGLAESVKHAVIRDAHLLDWHERHSDAIRLRDPAITAELIAHSCRIKAAIVAADEREAGLRMILNYGHTIGHALESLLDYELRHGECVALGMLVENAFALRRGLLEAAEAERIRDLIAALELPMRLPRAVDADAVVARCRVDKKVRQGVVHFALPSGIGDAARVADIDAAEIRSALDIIAPE